VKKCFRTHRHPVVGVFFLAVVMLSLSPYLAFAAAWVQPEGETYLSLSVSEYESGWYRDESGRRRKSEDGAYRKLEWKFYLEHGLTSETTLLFALPWQRAQKLAPSDLSESAFYDMEIGFRRRLWSRGFETASWQLVAGIPTGYSTDKPFRLGDGNTYLDLRYLWGISYERNAGYGFISLEAGIRHFLDGEAVDQFRMDGTWFHPFSPKWGTQITLSGTECFSISSAPGRNGYSLWKAGAGVVFSVTSSTDITLRNTWDFAGKNTGDGSHLELIFATRVGR
jgi:hypothetical protein